MKELFTNENVLLLTDSYKLSHALLYAPNTTEVYSYIEARKPNIKTVWFGLQYYLKHYLSKPIKMEHAEEFIQEFETILGPCPEEMKKKIYSLAELGYWPFEIKAVPEGSVVDSQNILLSIKNTLPEFYWAVGFVESLLLKIWNTVTVSTCSLHYKKLVVDLANLTCDNLDHIPFSIHDFGFRGCSSEETARTAGACHLTSFIGSDTVPAVRWLKNFYSADIKDGPIALSVPATEHSVMCSYGRDTEFDGIDHIIFDRVSDGIVSIVSDTYSLWSVLSTYIQTRKDKILQRNGKVVFRGDSGFPPDIICGDPNALPGSPENKGMLELLWDTFGGTVNNKGYRVLNEKVGVIYGDGMFYDRFKEILYRMKEMGFASSNLVIGIGGLLLQNHNRDEFGFAFKATRIIKNGQPCEIYKDPITDPGKKSKKGLMYLIKENSTYKTYDQCTEEQEKTGLLETVFLNGKIMKEYTLSEIRQRILDEINF